MFKTHILYIDRQIKTCTHTHTHVLTCPLSHGCDEGIWQWKTKFGEKHPAENEKFYPIVDEDYSPHTNKELLFKLHAHFWEPAALTEGNFVIH